ncbi:hypothetical protein DTO021C3_175 [Paecilomyces variotii]|nr:hypothetical protein DTO195F2_3761 [Paecilomyces variotii]KAJ9292282.1 hypothetical protein DTO021C3_175 [Paecilomyces variotii]KAJ9372153.1 hypothetical protein DTO282E5_3246 [Paecilomyces variotii]KAJ9383396.1 hypothetical protein DTO063F5_5232 [Paecilomyces variotii]
MSSATERPGLETERQWNDAIRKAALQNASPRTLSLRSASRVPIAQFLLLRIIYKSKDADEFDANDWGLSTHIATARQHLQYFFEFQAYLQNVALDAGVTQIGQLQGLQLGIFELPREQQRHVQDFSNYLGQRRPTAGSTALDVLPKADEETVNFALVDFLQAICLKVPGVYSRWVPTRLQMKANFGRASYIALLDGGLSIWGEPEKVNALVECKANRRIDVLPSVQFQEASQIAAWLMQEYRPASGDTGRIFLVSQNGTEVYLTLGTLDRQYLKYLTRDQHTSRFLKLHRYGPWHIIDAHDMGALAEIILAFALNVGDGK